MGEILGQNLIALRKKKKLTAEQVAKELGMLTEELQCYEYGIKIPSKSALEKLASYYGVDPAEFHIAENFSQSNKPVKDTTEEKSKVETKEKEEKIAQATVVEEKKEKVDDKQSKKQEKEKLKQEAKQKELEEKQKKLEEKQAKADSKKEPEPKETEVKTSDKELWRRFPVKLHIVLLILSAAMIAGAILPFYTELVAGKSVNVLDVVMNSEIANQAFTNVAETIRVPLYVIVAKYGLIALACFTAWDLILSILMLIPAIRRSGLVVIHKIIMIISTVCSLLLFFVFLLSSIFYIVGSGDILSYKGIGIGAMIIVADLLVVFIIKVCTLGRTKRDKYIKGDEK